MFSRYICKLERFISDLTRIKWLKCANCEFYEYKEFDDEIMGGTRKDFRCEVTRRFTLDWQYCCNFRKRKTENKQCKEIKTKLALNEAIKKHDKFMNMIYRKEDEIKILKSEVKELDERIGYLKRELGE
jgi:hypothetical protein